MSQPITEPGASVSKSVPNGSTSNGKIHAMQVDDAPAPAVEQQRQPSVVHESKPTEDAEGEEAMNGHDDGEIGSTPADSWQVAYIYGYLIKYTSLQSLHKKSLLLDVRSLERALLDSSPPSTSKLIRDPTTGLLRSDYAPATTIGRAAPLPSEIAQAEYDLEQASAWALENGETRLPTPPSILSEEPYEPIPPPSSPLIVAIMEEFHAIMGYFPEFYNPKDRKGWFAWVVRFVNTRLNSGPLRGGIGWDVNLMRRVGVKIGREDEGNFWRLKWEEKVHVMRHVIDYLLTYGRDVRKEIKIAYENERATNDYDSSSSSYEDEAMSNPLAFDPLGTIDDSTLYALDSSARIYSLKLDPTSNGVPEEFEWRTLTRSIEDYRAYIEHLEEAEASRVEASRSRNVKRSSNAVSRQVEDERKLLTVLTERMEDVEAVQGVIDSIEEKKARANRGGSAVSTSDGEEGGGVAALDAIKVAAKNNRGKPPPPVVNARSARLRHQEQKAQEEYWEERMKSEERERVKRELAEAEARRRADARARNEEARRQAAEERKSQEEEKARQRAENGLRALTKRYREVEDEGRGGRRISARLTMQYAYLSEPTPEPTSTPNTMSKTTADAPASVAEQKVESESTTAALPTEVIASAAAETSADPDRSETQHRVVRDVEIEEKEVKELSAVEPVAEVTGAAAEASEGTMGNGDGMDGAKVADATTEAA